MERIGQRSLVAALARDDGVVWTKGQPIATLLAMKRRRAPEPGTMKFVIIAIVFMVLMDQFVFGGKRAYIEEAKRISHERQAQKVPPVRVVPPEGKAFFEAVPPVRQEKETLQPKSPPLIPPPAGGDERNGRGGSVHPHPKIAIIIDDLGMDIKHSRQVLDLPAPVTLAFLPYGTKTKELAALGKQKGHPLIIHVPMEAMEGKLNIGPGGLQSGMSDGDFQAAFGKMLGSFDGYEGINNHMGSRLTQDKDAMDRLMKMLAEKDLYFVDSKTIQSSVAANEAAEDGVPYAERDVFLDHVETPDAVHNALLQTERHAMRYGQAIAIGHPKTVTIKALKAWIPTLKEKGIELVPVRVFLKKSSPLGEDLGEGKAELEKIVAPHPDPLPEGEGAHEELAPSMDMFPE